MVKHIILWTLKDEYTSTVDVMLDTTFEDADALAAYAKNPKHVAVADTRVRPFTANRACMDFEV